MPLNNRGLFVPAIMLAMASAGVSAVRAEQTGTGALVSDAPMPLGSPYTVGGVSYTPADPVSYDEVGYAVESGEGSQNGVTVNGEAFAPAAIAAAHKTLPLPSYVEVTALDSGRTILVRVNDRGPMRSDQLIALSPGAMAQLGVGGQGSVPVRVRRVNPPEQERAVLRAQGQAAERLETPSALLKVLRGKLGPIPATFAKQAGVIAGAKPRPKPVAALPRSAGAGRPGADFDPPPRITAPQAAPRPATAQSKSGPVPAAPRTGGYVVQVGAFSTQTRADALAKQLGARVEPGGGLWRVRLGPYPTQQAAQAGARIAAAKGFENARIMANDAR